MTDKPLDADGFVRPVETLSPNYLEIYSNYSRVNMTPWDVTLSFGTLTTHLPNREPGAELGIAVKMSPQQFKAFAANLPMIMAEWERQFGDLKLPDNFKLTPEKLSEIIEREIKKGVAPSPGR